MGKIKQGILGGFRGKVGTVVGSYWNGIFYMKALPQSRQAQQGVITSSSIQVWPKT